MRRTKIICTIGPASESSEMLVALADAGMDIARVNFSHATYEQFDRIKAVLQEYNANHEHQVELLQDLQGPRIRIGKLPKAGRILTIGETVRFSIHEDAQYPTIYINNPYLPLEMKVGEPLYLANGAMELIVTGLGSGEIEAEVVVGGILHAHKGINVPQTSLSISGLTEKDIADLTYGLARGVDWVAISFVQTAVDVEKLRALVGDKTKVITKLETRLGVQNIESIVTASDAIMIARGDLGIEVPVEELPYTQKLLVAATRRGGKLAITATQMMMSMLASPNPTRAEVTDIANAVWDGSHVLMLSDETAAGKYPIEAVRVLCKVIDAAEAHDLKPQVV